MSSRRFAQLIVPGTIVVILLIASATLWMGSAREFPFGHASPASQNNITSVSRAANLDQVRFEPSEIDLGNRKDEVSVSLILINRGTDPVRLTDFKTSCSCIVANPPTGILPPGQELTIPAKITLLGKAIGKHRFDLSVQYQDQADRPKTAQASIILVHAPDLVVTPRSLDLLVGDSGEAASSVKIIDFREKQLEIKSMEVSSPRLRASIVEKPTAYDAGWCYTLQVSYVGNRAELMKEQKETLLIKTDDPSNPLLHVDILLRPYQRLRVFPANIELAGTTSEAHVTVRDIQGETVEIESIETGSEDIKAVVAHGEGNVVKQITFTLNRPVEGTNTARRVTAQIKVKSPCQVTLPVTIHLGGASR